MIFHPQWGVAAVALIGGIVFGVPDNDQNLEGPVRVAVVASYPAFEEKAGSPALAAIIIPAGTIGSDVTTVLVNERYATAEVLAVALSETNRILTVGLGRDGLQLLEARTALRSNARVNAALRKTHSQIMSLSPAPISLIAASGRTVTLRRLSPYL